MPQRLPAVTVHKYQGTGNDFIIADNRKKEYDLLKEDQIRRLCDRRLGIGADGLMLLNEKPGYDFEMKYYNADGKEGSMCGNGGRCLTKFAYHLGINQDLYKFFAVDGVEGPHGREVVTHYSPAYDAGTEANDELCTHIPGPPTVCQGEGFNPSRGADNFVHIHSGIHGIGNLSAARYDWRNPVARITIRRAE